MRRAKKLTAWLLTLALILTLLPVSVLAAIPGTDDQDSRFKNMLLHSAVNRPSHLYLSVQGQHQLLPNAYYHSGWYGYLAVNAWQAGVDAADLCH